MNDINDVNARINAGAVKVYENDDMSGEFPVLKAFQQYIADEQEKSRRRIIWICLFFSFLMTVVISVFVILLFFANSRNQTLNDRLFDLVTDDGRKKNEMVLRENPNKAELESFAKKLEDLKTAIAEDRARQQVKAEAYTSAKASPESDAVPRKTVEALEIERLKALLAIEKEKASLEREKQRQAELEAYRRKQYPELYEPKSVRTNLKTSRTETERESEEADKEIEAILKEVEAIEYFDEKDVGKEKKENDVKKATENDVKPPCEIKDKAGYTWKIPE